jgi:hypothetical protein
MLAREPPGDQAGQPQVHVAAGEGIDVQVLPFARLVGLHQQRVRRGNRDSRCCVSSMGRAACSSGSTNSPAAAFCIISSTASESSVDSAILLPCQVGTVPLLRVALAHVGGHVAHPHEFQQAAGEEEVVARLQPRDEALLHGADVGAVHELHLDRRVADDGAHAQPVALGDALVLDAVHAVLVAHDAGGIRGRPRGSRRRARRTPAPSRTRRG